jgi:hypothetical protein
MDQIQDIVLARNERLDVVPVERRDPGAAQGADNIVQDLVPFVLVPLDLNRKVIAIGMLEELDE